MARSLVDPTQLNQKDLLTNTNLTVEYVLWKLYENNPHFVEFLENEKVVKMDAYDISDDKGYCSHVFKTFIWTNKYNQKPFTFVLKIPTAEAWSKILLAELKVFPKPEIYYMKHATSTQKGLIMMNDLSVNGITLGIFNTVTEQHCFELAKHVADFQVYVDFMDGKPWLGQFTDNLHATAEIEGIRIKMLHSVLSYKDKELTEKIKIIERMDGFALGKYATEQHASEIGCTTLCHGDLWTNNVIFNKNVSASNQIVSILDWQTLFEGSPLFDVARFITTSAAFKVRRECEYQVVDYYYDNLTKRYLEHKQTPNFTREQAHELYEIAFVQQARLFGIMFDMICNPLKDSKNKLDRENVANMALRLKALLDDAFKIIPKYPAPQSLMKHE